MADRRKKWFVDEGKEEEEERMSRSDWIICCSKAIVALNMLITVVVYYLNLTDGSVPNARLYLCIVLYGVTSLIGTLACAGGIVIQSILSSDVFKKTFSFITTKIISLLERGENIWSNRPHWSFKRPKQNF